VCGGKGRGGQKLEGSSVEADENKNGESTAMGGTSLQGEKKVGETTAADAEKKEMVLLLEKGERKKASTLRGGY